MRPRPEETLPRRRADHRADKPHDRQHAYRALQRDHLGVSCFLPLHSFPSRLRRRGAETSYFLKVISLSTATRLLRGCLPHIVAGDRDRLSAIAATQPPRVCAAGASPVFWPRNALDYFQTPISVAEAVDEFHGSQPSVGEALWVWLKTNHANATAPPFGSMSAPPGGMLIRERNCQICFRWFNLNRDW